MLWNVESKFINIDWNVYQALPLPDWDNDGIPELLVAHGGDFKYGPEVNSRQSTTICCPSDSIVLFTHLKSERIARVTVSSSVVLVYV